MHTFETPGERVFVRADQRQPVAAPAIGGDAACSATSTRSKGLAAAADVLRRGPRGRRPGGPTSPTSTAWRLETDDYKFNINLLLGGQVKAREQPWPVSHLSAGQPAAGHGRFAVLADPVRASTVGQSSTAACGFDRTSRWKKPRKYALISMDSTMQPNVWSVRRSTCCCTRPTTCTLRVCSLSAVYARTRTCVRFTPQRGARTRARGFGTASYPV